MEQFCLDYMKLQELLIHLYPKCISMSDYRWKLSEKKKDFSREKTFATEKLIHLNLTHFILRNPLHNLSSDLNPLGVLVALSV